MAKSMRQAVSGTAILISTMLTVAGFAQTAQEVLDGVKKKYDTINDAELKFSQTVRFAMSHVEQHTKGTLVMKKGDKYRVETEGLTVVTDGETVWSHSLVNNQVLIDRFKMDERSFSPERILLAAPSDFTATLVGREKLGKIEVAVIKLLPTSEQSLAASLKLWVNESDHLMKKVEMIDATGKETTYFLQEIRINTGVNDSRFTYQIPDGVEVVDLR